MKKQIFIYALSFALLLASVQYIQYNRYTRILTDDIYISVVALIFLAIGIYLTRSFSNKNVVIESKLSEEKNNTIENSVLSSREMEVLNLMSEGYSNQEIADRLFVSLNTIKTHISNIYLKLEVSRRTQAIAKAKEIGVL